MSSIQNDLLLPLKMPAILAADLFIKYSIVELFSDKMKLFFVTEIVTFKQKNLSLVTF